MKKYWTNRLFDVSEFVRNILYPSRFCKTAPVNFPEYERSDSNGIQTRKIKWLNGPVD